LSADAPRTEGRTQALGPRADNHLVGLSRSRHRRTLAALALVAALAIIVLALAPGVPAHPFHPGADTPDTTAPGLKLAHVGTFDYPVYVASPRGDRRRQVVVEQDGQIRMIKNGELLARPFLDISGLVEFNGGERGLFSIAFAPDYYRSGLFYVMYTQSGGDLRVDEFRLSANPDVALASSRRLVLKIEHSENDNHNGGQLQFPPSGGSLYISTGDGGSSGDPDGNGQDIDSLLGKILRINPRGRSSRGGYSIPSDNPFYGADKPGRAEIWHYGLRNPWRFSFDRATGNMAIGDVGQGRMEEIDFVLPSRRAANFGWDCFEGTLRGETPGPTPCRPGHVPPVVQYRHEGASCSVTGGFVLRDPSVPDLAGRYIYGDYCTGALHAAILRVGQATVEEESPRNRSLDLVVPRLTGFGEDTQGRLYMTSREYGARDGAVWRLVAAP
jgi:glucose/arabinose dehydrogenase